MDHLAEAKEKMEEATEMANGNEYREALLEEARVHALIALAEEADMQTLLMGSPGARVEEST